MFCPSCKYTRFYKTSTFKIDFFLSCSSFYFFSSLNCLHHPVSYFITFFFSMSLAFSLISFSFPSSISFTVTSHLLLLLHSPSLCFLFSLSFCLLSCYLSASLCFFVTLPSSAVSASLSEGLSLRTVLCV